MRLVWAGAVLAVMCGCGQPVASGDVALLRGRVSLLEEGTSVPMMGGGALAARAEKVNVWQLDDDHQLTLAGSGSLVEGRYAVIVPVSDRPTFVELADVHGVPLARAMVEAELQPRAEIVVQPVSTESSLQAAITLELERAGCRTSDFDLAGPRLRLDPGTALRVNQLAASDPQAAAAQVHALAMAEWSSQVALRQFISSQGLGWTAWRSARGALLAQLDQTLVTGEMTPEAAPARLHLALDQIDQQFGLDAELVAYRELRVASAGRAALRALSAAQPGSPAEAYEHASAQLQARQSGAALGKILELGQAPLALRQQATLLNLLLQRDVAAAEDDAAVVAAFARWRDAVRGQVDHGQLSAGLLQTWLPSLAEGDQRTLLLQQLRGLEAELDVSLAAAATERGGHFDAMPIAGAVSSAWTLFDFSTDRVVQQAVGLDDDHQAAITSLLIHSQSSFR